MSRRIWTKPFIKYNLSGDRTIAKSLERKARACVGYLFDQLMPNQKFRSQNWNYADGSRITAFVWRDVLGERARVEIFGSGGQIQDLVFVLMTHGLLPSVPFQYDYLGRGPENSSGREGYWRYFVTDDLIEYFSDIPQSHLPPLCVHGDIASTGNLIWRERTGPTITEVDGYMNYYVPHLDVREYLKRIYPVSPPADAEGQSISAINTSGKMRLLWQSKVGAYRTMAEVFPPEFATIGGNPWYTLPLNYGLLTDPDNNYWLVCTERARVRAVKLYTEENNKELFLQQKAEAEAESSEQGVIMAEALLLSSLTVPENYQIVDILDEEDLTPVFQNGDLAFPPLNDDPVSLCGTVEAWQWGEGDIASFSFLPAGWCWDRQGTKAIIITHKLLGDYTKNNYPYQTERVLNFLVSRMTITWSEEGTPLAEIVTGESGEHNAYGVHNPSGRELFYQAFANKSYVRDAAYAIRAWYSSSGDECVAWVKPFVYPVGWEEDETIVLPGHATIFGTGIIPTSGWSPPMEVVTDATIEGPELWVTGIAPVPLTSCFSNNAMTVASESQGEPDGTQHVTASGVIPIYWYLDGPQYEWQEELGAWGYWVFRPLMASVILPDDPESIIFMVHTGRVETFTWDIVDWYLLDQALYPVWEFGGISVEHEASFALRAIGRDGIIYDLPHTEIPVVASTPSVDGRFRYIFDSDDFPWAGFFLPVSDRLEEWDELHREPLLELPPFGGWSYMATPYVRQSYHNAHVMGVSYRPKDAIIDYSYSNNLTNNMSTGSGVVYFQRRQFFHFVGGI